MSVWYIRNGTYKASDLKQFLIGKNLLAVVFGRPFKDKILLDPLQNNPFFQRQSILYYPESHDLCQLVLVLNITKYLPT